MPDERYYSMCELGEGSGGTATTTWQTTAGRFDPVYARGAVRCQNTGDFIQSPPFKDAASSTDIWVIGTYYLEATDTNTNNPLIELVNSSGTVVFRLQGASNTNNLQAAYWTGAAMTTIGVAFVGGVDTRIRIAIHLTCGAASNAQVYIGGALVQNVTMNDADVNNVAAVRYRGVRISSSSGFDVSWTEMAAANFDIRDLRIKYDPPTGDSAVNTSWTGTYADVDEGGYSDVDMVSSGTAAQREGFTHATLAIATTLGIDSVWLVGRMKAGGGGPTNIKGSVRIGSTDYDTANMNPGVAFEAKPAYYTQDPSTSAAWTQAGYNAAEIGLLSVA